MLDSRIVGTYWVTPNRLFLLTSNGKNYRSEDTGISWTQEIFLDASSNEESISRIYYNSQYVIFFGRNGTFWVSNNQGKSFGKATRISESEDARYVRFHPFQGAWFLIGTSSNRYTGYHLYASLDAAQTFHGIETASSVYRFYWASPEKTNDQSIVYAKFKDGSPQNKYDVISTSNLGNTKVITLENANELIQLTNKLVATVESGFASGQLFIRISTDGRTWTAAAFPYDKDPLYVGKYYIVPWVSEAGQTITLAVTHGTWANMYGSDTSGLKYTLLEERVSYIWRVVDYVEWRSVDGVNLVNIVYDDGGQDSGDDDQTLPVLRKSKMSWDNGGEWHPIAPPRYNSLGQPIICSGECSLHLNGWSTIVTRPVAGPLYTDPAAVGLSLATGGVGEFLPTYDQLNTYFSRDAGVTWQEVAQGSTIYEFGDQGGIIIVADNINPTKSFKYTLDQGLKWYTYDFTADAVTVENIFTEPTNYATTFLIQALVPSDQSKESIFHVDFSNVFPRNCTEADLEHWSPTDPYGGKQNCLLGRNTTYTRRKQDVECFNTNIESTVSVVNCPCTEEDYECAFGYDAEIIQGQRYCTANGELPIPVDVSNCKPGHNYSIPSGFRKVPGDSCEGGVQHPNQNYTCPGHDDDDGSGSGGGLSALVVAFIVFAVLIAVAGLLIFVLRNPSIREKFHFEQWTPSFLYTPVRTEPASHGEQEFHFGTDSDDDESHSTEPMGSSLPITDQNL